MNTSLRGFGSFKRELLSEIFLLCGMMPFTFNKVKALPSFTRKSFFSLVSGNYILVLEKKKVAIYQLSKGPVLHVKNPKPTTEEWFLGKGDGHVPRS